MLRARKNKVLKERKNLSNAAQKSFWMTKRKCLEQTQHKRNSHYSTLHGRGNNNLHFTPNHRRVHSAETLRLAVFSARTAAQSGLFSFKHAYKQVNCNNWPKLVRWNTRRQVFIGLMSATRSEINGFDLQVQDAQRVGVTLLTIRAEARFTVLPFQ